LAKDVTVPAFTGTVDDALALITGQGGIPGRVDPDSGPVPRITLPAGRITCDALYHHLAGVIGMRLTQSADGMVLYRPDFQRYQDLDGNDSAANGKVYRVDHPAWWAYAQRVAKHPVVNVAMNPGDALISVHWRDIPLSTVADDLHGIAHMPVKLQVDAATASAPILLVMDERPLSDVLTCLGQASGSKCGLSADGNAITIAPLPTAGTDAPPAAAPAGKHTIDL